ncbi:unnamed protein product [Rhizoctonia solani]|uniref:holo-[acyl-carrier-protein] synthase n=1 Tax=Rhizoctonia solani TaxID=456999 RepID=A0A8H2X933_9AGAM|nr:unnamed protein product [Rhizoctonia solani]
MAESNATIYVTPVEWNNKLINNEAVYKPVHKGSLIGQLLPRYWLRQRQIDPETVRFGATEHGKPIIARGPVPLTYNVTHDSDMVVIACGSGESVGIDVMRVALPRRTSMDEFVGFVSEQATYRARERSARS